MQVTGGCSAGLHGGELYIQGRDGGKHRINDSKRLSNRENEEIIKGPGENTWG